MKGLDKLCAAKLIVLIEGLEAFLSKMDRGHAKRFSKEAVDLRAASSTGPNERRLCRNSLCRAESCPLSRFRWRRENT
jgi:hypothetical protein